MTTIRDIARMAGVSISTVSLAFSSPHRVSPDTLGKVLGAAEAVGYVADPVARSLASGKSRLIGMVVADISNPFFGTLLKEVERCATASGHLVIIADSGGVPAREREILDHMAGQRVAGIVLSPCGQGSDYARSFAGFRMPMVLFDQRVDGLERDFVGTDNRLASAMLTRHLLQLGHRRIGFIAGIPGLFTTRERVAGFQDTLAGAGIDADPGLIVDGFYEGGDAYVTAMRLLTRRDRPSAIVASNNVMALAALQAINELGFRCPEEISLAAVDDVPWANVIVPRLTAAVQDATKMGRLMAERLLARIADPALRDAAPRDIIVPPQFKLGASCRSIEAREAVREMSE
jgi:LacI family transcriptional regulator